MFGLPAPAVPQGNFLNAGEFGSGDSNPIVVECQTDTNMLYVEGPQWLDDTSIPNQIDDPMHDAHAEVGLG